MKEHYIIINKYSQCWLDSWGWIDNDCDLISIFDENDRKEYNLPTGGEWKKV